MIESKPNIEEIDFRKYLLVLRRRWIPAVGTFGLFVTLASFFAFSIKPSYTVQGTLLIKTDKATSLTGLGQAIGQVESLGIMTNNPLDTQAMIIASPPIVQETLQALNLKDQEGNPVSIAEFTSKLQVTSGKGTDVLFISYTDTDPNIAGQAVNKIIEIYIKNNIEANRAEAVSARKFILEQLPGTEASVVKAESDLRKFKEQNKIVELQAEAGVAVQSIATLETQISQAQARLVDITAQSQKLQNEAQIDARQAVTFASLSQTPGIQQALAQLQQAQTELAVQQNTLQPSHPTIINLEAKVASLKNLLDQRIQEIAASNQQISLGNLQIGALRQNIIQEFVRIEAERVGLVNQITTLTNQRSAYKQRANALPKLEQTQRQLERKLKASQATYETLLAKLQEVQLTENQDIGNVRVISPALLVDIPSSKRQIMAIAGGVVVGTIFGIIVAFSVDLIDPSLKTVQDAKELFQYTVLAVIPFVSKNLKKSVSLPGQDRKIPQIIGRDLPHFPIGNVYQMLEAKLKFLSSDKKIKTILVTSSVPGEGKSGVSANLAITIAQMGHRVLLVDADMRRPMQHHIWQIANLIGLSNLIIDQVSIHQSVQEVQPHLYVLTAGAEAPNPTALIDSQRMATLVETLAEDYDFIIFDTPPLAATADAAVLSKLVDGILMVVRPGVVKWNTANGAKEFIKQSGQNVLGMVINAVNVKQEPDSYCYSYDQRSVKNGSVSRNSLVPKEVASKVIAKEDM